MISDREIDRVARTMTDAEPSGALRARVMAALEPPHIEHAPLISRVTATNAVVVLCAISAAAAFLLNQPQDVPMPATPPVAVAVSAPPPPVVRDDAPSARVSTASARPARVEMSEEERAWQSRRLPPLPQAEPLAIDPIQPEPISIAPISVEPIVIR